MKHTKGPWLTQDLCELSNYPGSILVMSKTDNDPMEIIVCGNYSKESQQADARLISAAPEMLDLLVELLKEIEEHGKFGDMENKRKIENVLYKATGK